jgi:hypothetical protein
MIASADLATRVDGARAGTAVRTVVVVGLIVRDRTTAETVHRLGEADREASVATVRLSVTVRRTVAPVAVMIAPVVVTGARPSVISDPQRCQLRQKMNSRRLIRRWPSPSSTRQLV